MIRRPISRRQLVALGLAGLSVPALLRAQQGVPARDTTTGPLYDPNTLERRDAIVTETANDATVKAAEVKLACPCPCTLDVFTCRTTDFTCTYSPARHQEVVLLVEQGMGVQQILDTMVSRYGEEALMAPPAHGFNIVGYVLPASVILGLGAVITAIVALKQRKEMVAEVANAPASERPSASAAELAALERDLGELES